jgi:hypothetical protein
MFLQRDVDNTGKRLLVRALQRAGLDAPRIANPAASRQL